jgi:hypothetical protein
MTFPTSQEREKSFLWLLEACRTWILHKYNPGPETNSTLTFQKTNRDVLGKMAHYHNLEPLLHDLVKSKKLVEEEIPDELKENWEEAYFSTVIRNTEILDRLSQLLVECNKKNLRIIVLKGPSVIAEVYKDIGLRPMADLDVLCLKKDLLDLRDIVTSLGFTRGGKPYLHQLDFYNEKFDTLLELHFNLFHFVKNKTSFLDKAWKEQTEASIEDLHFPVLSLEHRIVFELAHYRFHRYNLALKHLLDFSARLLFLKNKIDSKKLLSLLRQTGLSEDFAFLSSTLKNLMDLPLPEYMDVECYLNKKEAFKKNLFDLSSSFGFTIHRRTGAELRQLEGMKNKLIYAKRRLFPPLKVLQAAYNLSSPLKAVFFTPVHLGKLCGDFRKKIKAGF